MAKNQLMTRKNRPTEIVLGDDMPKLSEMPAPPTSVRSLMFWLVVTGLGVFGGLGFWAATAELKSAVVADGRFEVDGDLRVVQHLSGGTVTEIKVREGDHVSEGEVIAQLDDTRSQAQQGLLVHQLGAALARQARLRAEFAGNDTISIGPELKSLVENYPSLEEAVAAQVAVFQSNKTMDNGQIAILRNRIDQHRGQVDGVTERLGAQEEQLALVRSELTDLETLFERGLTTKDRLIARQQNETQLLGDLGESRSEVLTIEEQISEYSERILQVQRDRKMAIADELQLLQEQIVDIRQRLDASVKLAEQLTVRAPISGRIVGFDLNTIGAVVEPGQMITRVVPEGSEFVVRGRVFPGDIDEVALGALVRVRLSAYSYRKTPPIEGVVTYISADALVEEKTGERYFEVIAEIPQESYAEAPGVTPVPSMPAQLLISTGSQTVLTYLLDPVLGALEIAMIEGN